MNKSKYDKYKDSNMMTCFYVSLAANWYWVLGAVIAFIANRVWGLSLLVPLALILVWVISAVISASMIKHASENPMPTEERTNVNPYSKSSGEYVHVEKPEESKPEEVQTAEAAQTAEEVQVPEEAPVNQIEELAPTAEDKTPEDFGLKIEGQTELDKALTLDSAEVSSTKEKLSN